MNLPCSGDMVGRSFSGTDRLHQPVPTQSVRDRGSSAQGVQHPDPEDGGCGAREDKSRRRVRGGRLPGHDVRFQDGGRRDRHAGHGNDQGGRR